MNLILLNLNYLQTLLIKKNKAFSTFEIILSILIFSFLMNIAFVKYREFKELREGRFKYQDLAAFGHIGRTDIDTPWERLNKIEELKKAINL